MSKITKTEALNALYNFIAAVAAIGVELPGSPVEAIIPVKWKPAILAGISIAIWLKSHWNLNVTPEGTKLLKVETPTEVSYVAPPVEKPPATSGPTI